MATAGLALMGVPTNSSGTSDGVARAPAVLRERGLAAALARRPGFTDVGDLLLRLRCRPSYAPGVAVEQCRRVSPGAERPSHPRSSSVFVTSREVPGGSALASNPSRGGAVTPVDACARLIREDIAPDPTGMTPEESEMAHRGAGQRRGEPGGQRIVRLSRAMAEHQPAEVEFRHLRYFAVVAEELHFGRAAARDLTTGEAAPGRTP